MVSHFFPIKSLHRMQICILALLKKNFLYFKRIYKIVLKNIIIQSQITELLYYYCFQNDVDLLHECGYIENDINRPSRSLEDYFDCKKDQEEAIIEKNLINESVLHSLVF